ncbi:MAG: putative heme iron utilization protein [Motiliproteus sp.]|jgi:putative heme iron utilization protein
MKNEKMEARLSAEVLTFINSRKSLQLSSLTKEGNPYASYAPFAIGEECLYVLLSEIAMHANNLQHHPNASVLIIQDEDSAKELFARVRVNYSVNAEMIELEDERWQQGIDVLAARHGERIKNLSEFSDFKLFKLQPTGGRFVKGFGRAYSLAGETLAGEILNHMTDGHKQRVTA